MKFKSLFLAAAIAASFSGVANAAIDGPTPEGSSINSDLVLFVYDTVKDLSYVQNLNVNYKDIIAENGSFAASYSLDTSVLNIFSTSSSSNLVWGMAASGADLAVDAGSLIGSIFSSTASPTAADYSDIAAQNLQFTNLASAINFNTAIGGSEAVTAGSGTSASVLSASVNAFSRQVSGAASFPNAAGVTTKQSLWFVHADDDYNVSPSSLASTFEGGLWTLDLSSATLSAPIPTPLPAAAWLMFSALMGLGGIARRRMAKA